MAESVKVLIQTRGQVKAHLTRFRMFLEAFDKEQSIIALETCVQKFEPLFERFDVIQSEIENSVQEEDGIAAGCEKRNKFETSYFELLTRARTLLQQRGNQGQDPRVARQDDVNNATEPQLGVKLPVIKIPEFDGSHERWIKFRDPFQSMIDDNPKLTNIQKFHYLDSAITGEAARAIEALGISAANYTTAWTVLKERFEDPKALSHYHVWRLFELTVMTKDSHISLRQLIDQANNHLLALKNLGKAVDGWDSMIVYLLSTKLDAYTKREWEKHALQLVARQKFKEIIEFLNAHCKYLERADLDKQGSVNKSKSTPSAAKPSKVNNVSAHVTQEGSYPVCKNAHNIYQCKEFIKLPTQSRFQEVRKHRLCFNCLKSNYQTKECTSGNCRKCQKKHDTLLHVEETSQENASKVSSSTNTAASENEEVKQISCNHTQRNETSVILATALVRIQDSQGKQRDCRALLDGGAQSHFITQDLCNQLNLKLTPINQQVSGLGRQQTNLNYKTEIVLKSNHNAYSTKLTCLVIRQITGDMPNLEINRHSLKIPKNLVLADPLFHNPHSIDLLIGAELFWSLLCVGQIPLGPSLPVLQKTKLGWVIGGPMVIPLRKNETRNQCHLVTTQQLHDQVARFWELEECTSPRPIKRKAEDIFCENHFRTTTTPNADGRFVVNIPFRENLKDLGQSKERAYRQFLAFKRKLSADPALAEEYRNFLQEYETSGHMSRITGKTDKEEETAYYLPHHAVRKEGSTTTKTRVVFNGSAKTSSGLSINDVQYIGPVIQRDLFSILVRFCKHKFVITADIKQMYRQILVCEEQRKYQRIIWRDAITMEIIICQLNTVTYGMASSPFVAIRSVQQTAEDNKETYPEVYEVILEDCYFDDVITGADSLKKAQELK